MGDVWTFVQCNSSGWGPALQYAAASGADAIAFQELRKTERHIAEAQQSLGRIGFASVISPARPTDEAGHGEGGCNSGSCAVTCKRAYGLGTVDTFAAAGEKPPCERFAIARIGCLLKHGIVFASLWLYPGEGLSQRNLDLLDAVGKVLRGTALPFVLAGDFNVSAACMAETGWVEAVGGIIVTPGEAFTCISPFSSSAIDFFIIDARLSGCVTSCHVDIDAHTRPHRPVVLKLHGNARSRTINVLWKPRDIPVASCIGCSPRPPDWTLRPDDDLNAAFGSFVSKAEGELLAMHGLSDQPAYRGRGIHVVSCVGVRFPCVQVMPSRRPLPWYGGGFPTGCLRYLPTAELPNPFPPLGVISTRCVFASRSSVAPTSLTTTYG
jgi:hypothetical protein